MASSCTPRGPNSRQTGEYPTFETRAETLANYVAMIQARVDTSAGRWVQGGGPDDRRVLDVLCMLALQALSVELEADIRRLALLAGIGRETARTALLRLTADGWIKYTRAADGPYGSRWTIDPQDVLHNMVDSARSQADPRPAGAGAAKRTNLPTQLSARSTSARHDVYSPAHGLGFHAGNTYARINEHWIHEDSAQALLQVDARPLRRLEEHGLIRPTGKGWRPITKDAPDRAASNIDVAGNLAESETRYTLEREVWGWWRTEQEWMNSARRQGRRKRPSVYQPALAFGTSWDLYPAYPGTTRRGAAARPWQR